MVRTDWVFFAAGAFLHTKNDAFGQSMYYDDYLENNDWVLLLSVRSA